MQKSVYMAQPDGTITNFYHSKRAVQTHHMSIIEHHAHVAQSVGCVITTGTVKGYTDRPQQQILEAMTDVAIGHAEIACWFHEAQDDNFGPTQFYVILEREY